MDQFDLFARVPSGGAESVPGRGEVPRSGTGTPSGPGAGIHRNSLSADPSFPADPDTILAALHLRGAAILRRVRLRSNRTVLWSLTDRGRTLNLHEAYAQAPSDILDALARLVREAPLGTPGAREAARRVKDWPPVRRAIQTQRAQDAGVALAMGVGHVPAGRRRGPACTGTEGERTLLRTLYLRMNQERFDDLLPPGVPLRLSRRMQRRLGHMRPGTAACGGRVVVEIALNRALLLPANRVLFLDTLLHEMAHAADWLVHAQAGHGRTWKEWAVRVGCHPTACSSLPFRRSTRRGRGRG